MIRRLWRNWGIAARLLAIVVLPASIMFVAVTATIYLTALNDVRRDVADRGRIIATALAQSSQYGLVSGNVGYIRMTLRDLLQTDAAIDCIEIMDGAGSLVITDCRPERARDVSTHDLPIQLSTTPDVDLFDPAPPSTDTATSPTPNRMSTRTIGKVRVTMSPAPILKARQQALLLAFGLVLAAAALSCFVGLQLARRLRHTLIGVMSALRDIRQGHFDVKLDADQSGELGELQHTIVQMADTLHAARHELEQQVATRTKELQDAVRRVGQADAEKRRLITHSNAAVEDERKRIAVDIHDHLGAALISVRLEASALAARAQSLGNEDMERDAQRIAKTAEGIYATTRDIVKSLRPEIIDTLGLSGAIEELVRHVDMRRSGCHFRFSTGEGVPYIRGAVAMPAYRITQEAINNIIKHARATQASVHLALTPDRQHLRIDIQDDGCGFDTRLPDHAGLGLGLIGMRERVAAVDGQLEISAKPGKGTHLQVTLPMNIRKP